MATHITECKPDKALRFAYPPAGCEAFAPVIDKDRGGQPQLATGEHARCDSGNAEN